MRTNTMSTEVIQVDWENMEHGFPNLLGALHIKAKRKSVNGKLHYVVSFADYKKIGRYAANLYTSNRIPIITE